MAKLIDILARELKVWPEGVYFIGQSLNGRLIYDRFSPSDIRIERADDTSRVTRAEWQAAVDELNAPKVVEWTGEGLPPTGTVLDWRERTGIQWVEATVLFITDSSVVLQRDDGFEWQIPTKETVFRPLRTAEQIAASEAREVELNRMVAITSIIDKSWARKVCSDLYDAGYRKQ